jgi:RNAse (barnase) inhibitor barstar
MRNEYLDSEFDKLVSNSNMPYNIKFLDFYGNNTKYLNINENQLNNIIKILKNEITN